SEREAGKQVSRGPWRERAVACPVPGSHEVFPMTVVLNAVTDCQVASLPIVSTRDSARCIAEAAQLLLPDLERGCRIDAGVLRAALERACGGTDAAGAWDWKMAYDACEAATVLFLRKFGPRIRTQAGSAVRELRMLGKVAALLPTHTRRSQESQALQQFSTPL